MYTFYLVQFTFSSPSLTSLVFGVYSPPGNTDTAKRVAESITLALQDTPHSSYMLLGDLNATFRAIDRQPFYLTAHVFGVISTTTRSFMM